MVANGSGTAMGDGRSPPGARAPFPSPMPMPATVSLWMETFNPLPLMARASAAQARADDRQSAPPAAAVWPGLAMQPPGTALVEAWVRPAARTWMAAMWLAAPVWFGPALMAAGAARMMDARADRTQGEGTADTPVQSAAPAAQPTVISLVPANDGPGPAPARPAPVKGARAATRPVPGSAAKPPAPKAAAPKAPTPKPAAATTKAGSSRAAGSTGPASKTGSKAGSKAGSASSPAPGGSRRPASRAGTTRRRPS